MICFYIQVQFNDDNIELKDESNASNDNSHMHTDYLVKFCIEQSDDNDYDGSELMVPNQNDKASLGDEFLTSKHEFYFTITASLGDEFDTSKCELYHLFTDGITASFGNEFVTSKYKLYGTIIASLGNEFLAV